MMRKGRLAEVGHGGHACESKAMVTSAALLFQPLSWSCRKLSF